MSAPRLTFYRQSGDKIEWRWTLTASNGRIVGASTESYRKRIDVVKNAALVLGVEWRAVNDCVADSAAHGIASTTWGLRRVMEVVVQP